MRLFMSLALCLSVTACDRDPGTDDDLGSETSSETSSETGTETETETETQTDPFTCMDGPSDAGDWWGLYNKADIVDINPYKTDAGIAAILAQAPEDGKTVTLDTPLKITGAVVTYTDFAPEGKAPTIFWFQDKGGALRTRDPDFNDPDDIKFPEGMTELPVGSTVSFDVKSITNYAGELQIEALDNFSIDTEGGSKIWVRDFTDGGKIDYGSHGRQIAHFWGEVTEERGKCGTPFCYTVSQGDNEYVLRIKKEFYTGDCIEVVHPVGTFANEIQFNVSDWDTVRTF